MRQMEFKVAKISATKKKCSQNKPGRKLPYEKKKTNKPELFFFFVKETSRYLHV